MLHVGSIDLFSELPVSCPINLSFKSRAVNFEVLRVLYTVQQNFG